MVVIISQNASIRERLKAALRDTGKEDVFTTDEYPTADYLRTYTQRAGSILLFLDFEDRAQSMPLADEIFRTCPLVTTIAISDEADGETLLAMMQCGVREVVRPPFTAAALAATLARFQRLAAPAPPMPKVEGDVYAFLPARPGCGATTLATYVAACTAETSPSRTLLLDYDLRLGLTSFLLRAESSCSIIDAVEHAERMDVDLWSKLVAQIGKLDLLGSAPMDLTRRYPAQNFGALLDFAKSQYNVVCVDLPGQLEENEVAALTAAKEIFLVCTPEVATLHLARRKADWIMAAGLRSKVSVLLNCSDKRSALSTGDIEKILQLPVRFSLPTDPVTIGRAVQDGKVPPLNSPIGKQIEALVKRLTGDTPAIAQPRKARRFVEYFSISPARSEEYSGR